MITHLLLPLCSGIKFKLLRLINLCLILVLVGESAFSVTNARHYPSIRRAAINILLTPQNLEESRKVVIEDSRGRPAYNLWITAISRDGRTTDSIELSLETTGRHVSDPEGRYEPNLLNPDYWGHGVGRWVIRPEEVCAANQDNPVVGARREFNFRRMRIVVMVTDVELSENFCPQAECGNQVGGFASVRVAVTIRPSDSMRRRPAGYDVLGWNNLELKKCR